MNFRATKIPQPVTASVKPNREFGCTRRGAMLAVELLENRTLLSAAIVSATMSRTAPSEVSPASTETLLGVFGVVNGKATKLKVTLGSGRTATFTLTGGSATAFQNGSDIDLQITSGANMGMTVTHGGVVNFSTINIAGKLAKFTAPASILSGTLTAAASVGTVAIGAISGSASFAGSVTKFTGGDVTGTLSVDGNVPGLTLGNVTGGVNIAGNLSKLTAKAVSGTIYAAGAIGKVKVGNVTGRIVAASSILSLSVTGLTGATILAGANLGSDGLIGGAGSAADTFGAGTIGVLSVSGTIDTSFVGSGVDPVDNIFGNGNDNSAGTGLIKSVIAKNADATSRFESSAFGVFKLPGKVNPTTDPRFIVL